MLLLLVMMLMMKSMLMSATADNVQNTTVLNGDDS